MGTLLVATALCGVLTVLVAWRVLSGMAASSPAAAAPRSLAGRASSTSSTVVIGWVGDITPGSRYGTLPGDGRALFAAVRALLLRPEVMVANLEGTLGTEGTGKCPPGAPACFAFQAPPATARGLRWAGIDVVNLANNHSFDYGPDGRRQTLAALKGAGLAVTGLPDQIGVVRRGGIRVAFVGFSTYPWGPDLRRPGEVAALVSRATREADVVVAVMHAGAEGSDHAHTPRGPEYAYGEARGDVRAFARQAIDAGADLVLGSGPHVLRGLERYRDRLIAYSLGNFAGVRNFSTAGHLSLSAMLTVRVSRRGRFLSGRLVPLRLSPSGTPYPDGSRAALRFVDGLAAADFGASAARIDAHGAIRQR